LSGQKNKVAAGEFWGRACTVGAGPLGRTFWKWQKMRSGSRAARPDYAILRYSIQ
jgi:hypothetical protein